MSIDVNKLATDIKTAATKVLGQDISTYRGFSEDQVKAITEHAALIEHGIQSGGITEATQDYFLDSLEDMTLNFVKTLRGLLMVTIEKVWNAIVNVLWKTLGQAVGINITTE